MLTLEEMGVQVRGYVIDLKTIALLLRATAPASASQIEEIANNITKTLNGENHGTRNN